MAKLEWFIKTGFLFSWAHWNQANRIGLQATLARLGHGQSTFETKDSAKVRGDRGSSCINILIRSIAHMRLIRH